MAGMHVARGLTPPKTPEELNAEFVRIAADLGEGIAEAVAAAVAEERAAVVAWLRAAYAPNTIVPLPDFLAALLRMVEKGEHHLPENNSLE